jgi:anti-sigma regulatory factor (Ser/Thr protein kinase)
VPSSISNARHFVADRLEGFPPTVIESASLMVSELCTNSIRHAHTGFTLEIEVTNQQINQQIRIAIVDSGSGLPEMRSPRPDEPSGRGLRIVELLSDEWGVIPSTPNTGKTVWFKVSTTERDRRLQEVPRGSPIE